MRSKARQIWQIAARAPVGVRVVLVLLVLYLASPIDLIPDFIPVLGQLDDVLVLAWGMRYIARHVPELSALLDSWKNNPRGVDVEHKDALD